MSTLATKEDYSLYSNAFGFLRAPFDFEPAKSSADVVVLGLPFDLAVTGRSGARMGPNAIRKASVNLAWESKRWPWNFKLSDRAKIVDCGDLVYTCGDPKEFTSSVEKLAFSILEKDKLLLSFGGDHYVTLPLLRAYARKHGKLAMIHFDAHTDTYAHGGQYDHGTMFYHAPNEGIIDPNHSIQLGIRTEYETKNHKFEVIDAAKLNDLSVEDIVERIKNRVGNLPVYMTFDIDCLDPAFAPGTGTPVCGGINSDKALKIIRGLEGINLVGMDVVEVSPAYDSQEITALAGATLALEMLYLWANNKG